MTDMPASATPDLKLEIEGPIAWIVASNPERMNAFTARMAAELIEAFDRADADDEVKVVIVTGAGRAFCAGADLQGGGETWDRHAAHMAAQSAEARYVGDEANVVGMTGFGASAPAPKLYEHFGITAERLVALARRRLS